MTTFNWLQLIGIPALTALFVGLIFRTISEKIQKNENDTTAVRNGVQALLRSQLYHCYNACKGKGYASLDDRTNFENLYKHYHALGANGVMDDVRKKFLHLPTENRYRRENEQ